MVLQITKIRFKNIYPFKEARTTRGPESVKRLSVYQNVVLMMLTEMTWTREGSRVHIHWS